MSRQGSKKSGRSRSSGRASSEDLSCFHGFMAREDLEMVLKKPGDYLLRLTETAEGQGFEWVLSVAGVGQGDDGGPPVRNLVVRQDDNGMYGVVKNGPRFKTIVQFMEHYAKARQVVSAKGVVPLLKAVPHQSWELRRNQVKLQEKLGEGAFGEVRKGVLTERDMKRPNKTSETAVAVKCISNSKNQLTKAQVKEIMNEVRLMKQYKHMNIVRFYGVVAKSEPILIVMELVNGSGLDKFLQKNVDLALVDLIGFCLDAARGLAYLHDQKCIHRDVAARNCLVHVKSNGRRTVKISDFGLCRNKSEYKMDMAKRVPIKWLAPETMREGLYTYKTDVYSYAILMWEIYSDGVEPFVGVQPRQVQIHVLRGLRLDRPKRMPTEMKTLMGDCWSHEPDHRPAFRDVVNVLEDKLPTNSRQRRRRPTPTFC